MTYIDKNNIGGYSPLTDNPIWEIGSMFASEGERLYDLIREHKPKTIIEVGSRFGCSAFHMATACRDNGFGVVYCFDIEKCMRPIPKDLKKHIKFHLGSYFHQDMKECDLLFEDGAHTTGFTKRVLEETTAKVIVVHDYLHRTCQETVFNESNEVLGEPTEVFDHEESDCGLAIWIK